jgi:hypothetical protein
MKRKVFDVLASAVGGLVVIVLLVAGALLMWGYSFANSNVHNQLSSQQIYFPTQSALAQAKNPPPGGFSEITPAMVPYLKPFAGQQVLTGQQAEVYADHFIADHLTQMPYHGVYANVSAASMANPKNAALAAEVDTTFKGTTLRGMLLEAYAFWKIGQIALWAGIASFSLAFVMALLSVFGLLHARKVKAEAEITGSRKLTALAA